MGVFKRHGNWWIDYYVNGRRRRRKIGPQKTLAKLALQEVKQRMAKGEFLGVYEEKRVRFKDFTETYIDHIRARLSERNYERAQWIVDKRLSPRFGNEYLFQINRRMVEDYIKDRLTEVSSSTVNREVSRLRHMLNTAVKWGYINSNPCQGVKELREPPGRIRFLTVEEIDRLLHACSPDGSPSKPIRIFLRPIVEIALCTGARRAEILSLRWKNIDLKEKRIILEETKNNERRVAPLNNVLCQVFQNLPRHLHSDRVFPDIEGNMVTMAFRRACKRAGLEDFRFHDLRHCFASYLTMRGYNLRTVQTLLGHKSTRMTERYSHLSQEHLQEAVQELENSLNLIPNGHYLDTKKKKRLDHTA
jgi:integrase